MKPIESWFGTFPIKEAETRLAKLVAQRADLDREITELKFWIARYRQRHPAEAERAQPELRLVPAAPASANGAPNGDKPTFRQSIARTMAAHGVGKEWNLNELRHELANRGAMTLDKKGDVKLMSMLSLMTKADQLERVKTGVYRLKVAGQEARGVM